MRDSGAETERKILHSGSFQKCCQLATFSIQPRTADALPERIAATRAHFAPVHGPLAAPVPRLQARHGRARHELASRFGLSNDAALRLKPLASLRRRPPLFRPARYCSAASPTSARNRSPPRTAPHPSLQNRSTTAVEPCLPARSPFPKIESPRFIMAGTEGLFSPPLRPRRRSAIRPHPRDSAMKSKAMIWRCRKVQGCYGSLLPFLP